MSVGRACGFLWTICKGINIGDSVIFPDGTGLYHVAEVVSNYSYQPDGILLHRRSVRWHSKRIERDTMSDALKKIQDLLVR